MAMIFKGNVSIFSNTKGEVVVNLMQRVASMLTMHKNFTQLSWKLRRRTS
jgi:hypothetical protein